MARLILDTVERSGFDDQGQASMFTRTGFVTELELTQTADPDLVFKARDIVVGIVGPTHPTRPEYFLSRVIGQGVFPGTLRVELTYTNNFGGTPSTFIITDDAFEDEQQTQYIPGTGKPILVEWVDPEDPPAGEVRERIPPDLGTLRIGRSVRAMTVQGLVYGQPDGNLIQQDYIDYVNESPWRGKDAAFWKITRWRTSVNRFGGYYTYEGQAVSRVWEDWREFIFLKHRQTGRFAPVDPEEVQATIELPYVHDDFIGGTDTNGTANTNGFACVGPYPLTDFGVLFGFS